jgi:cation:H+ antiporter
VSGLVLLAIAGVSLSVGADLFTEHASDLARHWHVHPLAIGLLLAGAEPEELVTALTAAHRHHDALAVGDVIGANVTMLTLVVGIAASIGPFRIAPVRRYFGAALACSALAAAFVSDGTVSRLESAVLLVAYAMFVWFVLAREHAPEDTRPASGASVSRAALALVGLGFVITGGWLAVTGAEQVVDRFDLGESAVGLTFVALATSGELFALLWASRRRGVSEFALAAIAGSVAANATASLGVTGMIFAPLATGGVRASALLVCVACAFLAAVRLRSPLGVRSAGVLLVGTYGAYVILAVQRP